MSSSLVDHFVQSSGAVPSFSHKPQDETKKLVSVFERVSPQEIEQEKLKSMKPLSRLPKEALEVKESEFGESIDFPKRPCWDYDMTKEQVEEQEQAYFSEWVKNVQENHGDKDLSWFEHNIEVWRQLWRVLEISDIILIVMDIRNPLLHFPRSLYTYITQDLKKSVVGVFNKVDLVAEFTVFAWKKFFEQEFPHVHIATFSCYPRDERLIDDTKTYALKSQAKRPRKRYYHAQGVQDIFSVCSKLHYKPTVKVDWEALIARYNEDSEESDDEEDDSDTGSMDGLDDAFAGILNVTNQKIQPHKDYITLGCVGHPNVGKSSLINSIMKRTVVSASKTPGHTKHFQTIYIANNVRLCDSPGLVFPAKIPRALQILSGMYPIAQVQEPYSAIGYLAKYIPLEDVLSLSPFDVDPKDIKDYKWSTWSLCEAFAEDRGFHTAKTAQPDIYRAANAILRLTAEGRVLLSFKPPGFFTSTKYEKLRVIEADERHDTSEEESEAEVEKIVITSGGFGALATEDDE